jgi:hypothetical protein
MLPENMFACVCGASWDNWESRGASVGGEFSTQNWRCAACGRTAFVLHSGNFGPLALVYSSTKAQDKILDDYVNSRLVAQWRDARSRHEGATPTPPELPSGVVAFLADEASDAPTGWGRRFTAESTKGVSAPRDPIAVQHDEYWAKLLSELGVTEYKAVGNDYDGNSLESWYDFTLRGAHFHVGPRKRVDVIEVGRTPPVDCAEVRALAQKDNVTEYGAGTEEERFVVHAWVREKFVEYFRLICASLEKDEAGH